MKQRVFAFLLPFFLLSCSSAPQDPSVIAKEYFDAYETAAKKGMDQDAFGVRLDHGKFEAALEAKDAGETKNYGIRIEPAVFDFRMDGLKKTSMDEVGFSLLGKTEYARDGSKIYLTGEELFDGALVKNGLPLQINAYFQQGTFYLDLYDSGVLRRGINEAIKANVDSSFAGFPSRSHKTLSEEDKAEASKELPLSSHLTDIPTKLREEMDRIFKASPEGFAFSSDESGRNLTFNSTEWSTLRKIVDGEILPDVADASIDVSSYLDDLEKDATLDRFKITLHYDESAWKRLDFDLAFTFHVPETEDFRPVGTWRLSGSFAFLYGEKAKPVKLSDTDKQRYRDELVFPDFSREEEQ